MPYKHSVTQARFQKKTLEHFNIKEEDVYEINRSFVKKRMTHPNETAKKYDLVDIDYNKYLEPYLSF